MRNLKTYLTCSSIRFLTATYLTVALTFSTTSLLAAEDYYTWVDENGVTNYAQKNPLGYQAQFVSKTRSFGRRVTAPVPVQSAPSIPDSPNGATEIDPDTAVAEERAIIEAQISKVKRSNCSIGKKNLVRLEMFSRVRVTDDNGESRTLTDEEKRAKESEARKIIKDNCSG